MFYHANIWFEYVADLIAIIVIQEMTCDACVGYFQFSQTFDKFAKVKIKHFPLKMLGKYHWMLCLPLKTQTFSK